MIVASCELRFKPYVTASPAIPLTQRIRRSDLADNGKHMDTSTALSIYTYASLQESESSLCPLKTGFSI